MRIPPSIVSIGALALSVIAPRVGLAQATTPSSPSAPPPVVVTSGTSGATGSANSTDVPPAVAKLIQNFDTLRDKYLLKQHLLLEDLKGATTPEQRKAIREQLQANRQAFLDELADFRTQLKDELKSVAGRVSNAEYLRIIESTQGGSGNTHHRGN